MVEILAQSPAELARTSEGKAVEIERLVAPALQAEGYDVVRVLLSGDRRVKLQIMLERKDGQAVTVEDCALASRLASAILDVDDPLSGAYVLEVSSPGVDRPLTRLKDFERFAGFEARVELHLPVAGRRRFRGRILGLDGDRVRLAVDEDEQRFAFADIAKAKLVLSDDLIAASGGSR